MVHTFRFRVRIVFFGVFDCIVFNMPKLFHCSKCGREHKRPVGSKCQMHVESNLSTPATSGGQNVDDSTNSQILSALNAEL